MNARMNVRVRRNACWIALAGLTFIAAGCGSSGGDGESPGKDQVAAAEPGQPKASYGVTVGGTGEASLGIPRRLNCEGVYIGRTYSRSNPDEIIDVAFHVQSVRSAMEMTRLFAWYDAMLLEADIDESMTDIMQTDYSTGFEFAGKPAQWQGIVMMGRFVDGALVLDGPKYWSITGGTNLMQQIGPEAAEEFGDRRFKHMLIGSCCDENMKPIVHWGEPRAGYPMEDNGEFLYWKFADLTMVGGAFHASKFTSLKDLTLEDFNTELDRLNVE